MATANAINSLQQLTTSTNVGFAVINSSISATGTAIQATTSDPGAVSGPNFEAFRNSASPAAADAIGAISLTGRSSTGVKREYANITGNIIDASNTAEKGGVTVSTMSAGTSTQQISVLDTGCQIRGNNTNTAPPAGYIGEVLSGANTTGTAMAAGTGINISSVTLTPGIWDVSGVLNFIGNGGVNTVTYAEMAISATSGANFTPADDFGGGIGMLQNQISGAVLTTTTNANLFCGPGRLRVSTNTTYYLNGVVTAATLNANGYGVIRAVRVG